MSGPEWDRLVLDAREVMAKAHQMGVERERERAVKPMEDLLDDALQTLGELEPSEGVDDDRKCDINAHKRFLMERIAKVVGSRRAKP